MKVFLQLSDTFDFAVYVTISGFWMFPPSPFFNDLYSTYSIYGDKWLVSFFAHMEKGCH